MNHERNPSESLPQDLIKALRSADRTTPLVTSRVDREIKLEAQAHFSSRTQALWQSRPAWAAVAAVLLVVIVVVGTQIPVTKQQPELYADIDGSGQIDIADVMALARENANLSQDEIDAFAMQIVALNRNGDSS